MAATDWPLIGEDIVALQLNVALFDGTPHPPLLAVKCLREKDHPFFYGQGTTAMQGLIRGQLVVDDEILDQGDRQRAAAALAPWGPAWTEEVDFLIAKVHEDAPRPGLMVMGVGYNSQARLRAARVAMALAQCIDNQQDAPSDPPSFAEAVNTASIAFAQLRAPIPEQPPRGWRDDEPRARMPLTPRPGAWSLRARLTSAGGASSASAMELPPPPPPGLAGQWLWWDASSGPPPADAWTVADWVSLAAANGHDVGAYQQHDDQEVSGDTMIVRGLNRRRRFVIRSPSQEPPAVRRRTS